MGGMYVNGIPYVTQQCHQKVTVLPKRYLRYPRLRPFSPRPMVEI